MNRYCELARLNVVPSVDELSATTSNLFLLMVAAKLEKGEPMRIEEVALRLWMQESKQRVAN